MFFFVLNHVLFKVRLEGYNYIGMGNSTNKKDAQSNAARDFVNYLVRTKEVSAGEVPALGVSITSVFTSSSPTHLYYDGSGLNLYCFQVSVPDEGNEEGGGGGGFGNLPSNCPLPPHLTVKKESGGGILCFIYICIQ